MSITNQITPASNNSAATEQIDPAVNLGGGYLLGFGAVGGGAVAGSTLIVSSTTFVEQIDSSIPHPTPTTTNQISP